MQILRSAQDDSHGDFSRGLYCPLAQPMPLPICRSADCHLPTCRSADLPICRPAYCRFARQTFRQAVRSRYSKASRPSSNANTFESRGCTLICPLLQQVQRGGEFTAARAEHCDLIHHELGCVKARGVMESGFHHHGPAWPDKPESFFQTAGRAGGLHDYRNTGGPQLALASAQLP